MAMLLLLLIVQLYNQIDNNIFQEKIATLGYESLHACVWELDSNFIFLICIFKYFSFCLKKTLKDSFFLFKL